MNVRSAAVILVVITAFTLSGCASKKIKVKEGDWKKLYAPSGLYVDLFTDPEGKEGATVTVSTDDYDAPQMAAYYEGENLEKLIIIDGDQAAMIVIDGELHNSETYTFKTTKETEGKREILEYRLVPMQADGQTKTIGIGPPIAERPSHTTTHTDP